jgi:hypothetical protein
LSAPFETVLEETAEGEAMNAKYEVRCEKITGGCEVNTPE